MWKSALVLGLSAAVVATIPAWARGQERPVAGGETRTLVFDDQGSLSGWTLAGGVTLDSTKSRDGKGASLHVSPDSKALLKLRDQDGSGKVEFWVYDDGTKPANPKTNRVGPRWGLVQNDGKLLAVGILYAPYLGGAEGYTATACNGQDWFNQLFWLGVSRTPAGWHKWTFDFDPEAGLQVFHNGREVTAVDSAKTGLGGFNAVAIWGDAGQGEEQTIWVDDLSITLGGPAKIAPAPGEADPYDAKALQADQSIRRPVVIYSRDNAPATPGLEDLPLRESLSQHGMTWTFEKPARAGQFVNGDWYVVGPVTVKAIDPRPLYGSEIPKG